MKLVPFEKRTSVCSRLIGWFERLRDLITKCLMNDLRGGEGHSQARNRNDRRFSKTFGNDRAECQIDNAAIVSGVNDYIGKLNVKIFAGNPEFLLPDLHRVAGYNSHIVAHLKISQGCNGDQRCVAVDEESSSKGAA